MSRLMLGGAAALVVAAATGAGAQVAKQVAGEMKSMTVTIEAIERSGREVTVKKPDGTYDVLYVPTTVRRFDALNVGDRVSARYYENMVIQLKAAGQQDVNAASSAVTRAADAVAAVSARQRTLTATITGIDPQRPSITFSGPNGWTYSSRVKDKDALGRVKVGDKVDITWTEALALSLDPAP
jgi:hypothetical protein